MKKYITTITIKRYFGDEEKERITDYLEREYAIERSNIDISQISNEVNFDDDTPKTSNEVSFLFKEKYWILINIFSISSIIYLAYSGLYAFVIFGCIFYAAYLFVYTLEHAEE